MPKSNNSPMRDYIEKYDLAHIDEGFNQYYVNAVKQDYRIWNALFIDEINFREANVRNLVFSIEGTQGDGKSAGLLRLLCVIAEIFGTKFALKYMHFFQEHLRKDLKRAKKRTQHGVDEQPRLHGLMANMVQDDLANYEDTFRKPQISIGYASPTLRAHEHFFIFEAMGHIEIGDESEKPESVELLLKTRRKSDKMIMPRGVLKLSWPEWDFWEKYEQKKDKFIKKMQEGKGAIMEQINAHADEIIDKYGEKLYRYLKNGERLPASKNQIDLVIYDHLGMRQYTVKGYEILREAIKQRL